jgi:hypothetical protein
MSQSGKRRERFNARNPPLPRLPRLHRTTYSREESTASAAHRLSAVGRQVLPSEEKERPRRHRGLIRMRDGALGGSPVLGVAAMLPSSMPFLESFASLPRILAAATAEPQGLVEVYKETKGFVLPPGKGFSSR